MNFSKIIRSKQRTLKAIAIVSAVLMLYLLYFHKGGLHAEHEAEVAVQTRSDQIYEFKSMDTDVWIPQTSTELLQKLTSLMDVYNYTDADVKLSMKSLKLAVEEMSGFLRKSGRPYFQHCIGMAGCLLDLGASFEHVLSGLLHSIYVFGARAQALTNQDDVCKLRKKIIEVVGLGTEYYIWGYTVFPRGNLDDSAMRIAREALDRGLLETTKMGPKLKDAMLGHLCNELDEFYQLDQTYSGNRHRSQAFRQNATYFLNQLGYSLMADKLLTLYSKQDQIDNPASEHDKQHTETVKKFREQLYKVFQRSPKYGAKPRKFQKILDFDKIEVPYVLDHFDEHYSLVENMCPDIPLYEPKKTHSK